MGLLGLLRVRRLRHISHECSDQAGHENNAHTLNPLAFARLTRALAGGEAAFNLESLLKGVGLSWTRKSYDQTFFLLQ